MMNQLVGGGGDIQFSFLKMAIMGHLDQKVLKSAKTRYFQVLTARNTGFWEVDKTPYIIHG